MFGTVSQYGEAAFSQFKRVVSSFPCLTASLAASCTWNIFPAPFDGPQISLQNQEGIKNSVGLEDGDHLVKKETFIANLIANMTVPELVLQLHLMSADNIVGLTSNNEDFDLALQSAPGAGIGTMHDLYVTNSTQYNTLQVLSSSKSRLGIPFLQFGECLHGVGSFRHSMFPQSIGMAASFDTDLVQRVGRAIGSEARSIGIHACFSPVLDLGLDPRWGRVQEAWGEDMLLTSQMGVAMSSGMSKNGSWGHYDAVVPVVKHFATHGSPQGGINGAPSMVLGTRQVIQQMLRPFKAVMDLGGVGGVMMAYSELDGIPSHVHPMLYEALDEWGFDGLVIADDRGMAMLEERHLVAASPADAIRQWFNAGGMIQFYDYSLETFLEATVDLVNNGSISLSTLQSRASKVLGVKCDLGLFEDRYISENISSQALTDSHVPLTFEAARKSIVLLENRNSALPIEPAAQNISKIALIGPFSDTLNYGDYSGQYGASPTSNSTTIRQAMLSHLSDHHPNISLVSAWGVNDWYYNAQRNIPGYLLSTPNDTIGGLLGTYYADTELKYPVFERVETPNRDWGLFPPNGLPSNNFSVVWEGYLTVPVDNEVNGWIGVGASPNCTAKLYIDDMLVQDTKLSSENTIQSNILSREVNETAAPAGGSPFTFKVGKVHKIRLEFQAWNLWRKYENVQSFNSMVELFWNLVDRSSSIAGAVSLASTSNLVVLTVGANWNSDGESADRSTLSLSAPQTALTEALLSLDIPIVLILQGGRPFAVPDFYDRAAAVVNAYFPGQSGGQAISDVLFGKVNPGGRVPVTVPRSVGTLPVAYTYKDTARHGEYLDAEWQPCYSFGYGLSYTTFMKSQFAASSSSGADTFGEGDIIMFTIEVTNTGMREGSYVAQVYLLGRVSSTTQPMRQLMAFQRVYLNAGERKHVNMELEVDRYLPILNRRMEWELESGEYVFALLDGAEGEESGRVTLTCH